MTVGERSAIRSAVAIVLLAALGRWVVDVRAPRPDPLAGRPDESARLDSASEARAAEEAARRRPLEPGERLDANRAPEPELDRLPGIGPSLAAAWVAHRRRVGGYRSAEDLTAVPGIGPATAARLAPLLQFSPPGPMLVARDYGSGSERAGDPSFRPRPLDLNQADSAALMSLPGVGPALAGRILARRREGPFRRPEDLLDVRGIGPVTLERLRSRVMVGRP